MKEERLAGILSRALFLEFQNQQQLVTIKLSIVK